MKPAGEYLYRDRFRLRRPDCVEVLTFELADSILERRLDQVEVADHSSLVKGRALDDDLYPVIVFVEITLGRREPRDTVQRP